MEIGWGNFYFQCDKQVAILIIAVPLLAVMQLPPVIRGVTVLVRFIARVRRSKYVNSVDARVMTEEKKSSPERNKKLIRLISWPRQDNPAKSLAARVMAEEKGGSQ